MYQLTSQPSPSMASPIPLRFYENEDIEGWLVEEGIGYFDRSGIYHDGPDPELEFIDIDLPPEEPPSL